MHFDFISSKTGHKESIELQFTPTGWLMIHPCYQGTVAPNGTPYLQQCVTENSALAPSALGDAFEEIWEAANQHQIDAPEIQRRLDIFSEWVTSYTFHKQPSPVYSLTH